MSEEDINRAIKTCPHITNLCDIAICRLEILPCAKVINNGKCTTLIELFRSESGENHENDRL